MTKQDEDAISLAGHTACNEADALNRIIQRLHATPVMQADLILGGVPAGVPMKQHRENLAKAEAALKKHGNATFIMQGEPNSLEFAVELLRQAVANAEQYASDRRK